ncbi:MAG: chemotaxis protein CheW [Dethiobacteria bacterium]|nr:chemotaxis protein CheW [Dethiobacteria bacterium]
MEYYKLLGVEKAASSLEIKSAYRKLARQYHPDFNPGKNTTILFNRIKNAFDTLYDPVKREQYDDAMCYRQSPYVNGKEKTAQGYYASHGDVIYKRKDKPVEKAESRITQLLAFSLAEEEYALKVSDVLGIIGYASIIPLARASGCVEGLVNARGEELPVVDLAKNFGFTRAGAPKVKSIVLVEIEGIKVGLIVDSVPLVVELSNDLIFDLPANPPGDPLRIMKVGRIDERIIIIPDLDQLLSPATLAALKELTRNVG